MGVAGSPAYLHPLAMGSGDLSGSPIPHPPLAATHHFGLWWNLVKNAALSLRQPGLRSLLLPEAVGLYLVTKKVVSYSLPRHKHISHLPLSSGPGSNELTALSQQLEAFASFERRAREVGGVPGLPLSSNLSPPTCLCHQVELWLA